MSETEIPNVDRLILRWTIGEVRDRGFEMLRLSIACAYGLFGPSAKWSRKHAIRERSARAIDSVLL